MNSYDLRNNPKCPYGNLTWKSYYWEYPRDAIDYESGYWGRATDPDGNRRDMLSEEERQKHIEDSGFIIDHINAAVPGKILDIGCGPGYLLSAVENEWEKHGTDISSTALNRAREYAEIRSGEFPHLQYPDNYFDVIILNHVVEHLPQPLDYITESWRVLKPGGILILSTPDFDSGCARRFKSNFRMLHDRGHISLFTSFSVVRMLEDFNFRICEIDYPFFNTRYFSEANLIRLFDVSKVSPPFYGNHLTVIAAKISHEDQKG